MKKLSILKRDKNEEIVKYLNKIRKNIPDKYNKAKFLDYLSDPKVDLMFSITTRGDGKTFNTLYCLAKLSEKFDFTTVVIVRHLEIRSAMIQQIRDVYETMKDLNVNNFAFKLNMDYVKITYGEKTSFIICDLNNANDLKNYSAVLRHCNLILYDEFLAVGGEYAPHEFEKFKTIFETMDRDVIPPMEYTNKRRKAIFLANPVDFSSEFLAQWRMYHYLESQPMNTIKRFKNIVIERRKNEVPQEHKNNRIFNDETNESILGKFHVNNWMIKEPIEGRKHVTVKTTDKYINVYLYANKPILDVVAYEKKYQYNTDLADNTSISTYCKPSFYRENFYRKYTKDNFYFSNQFSKSYILDNYPTLNFNKIVRQNIDYQPSVEEQNETRKEMDLKFLRDRLFNQYL